MLMSTLFPCNLATRERLYDSLTKMWTTFASLKYNTSPAIDGGAFASVFQGPSSYVPPMVTTPVSLTALLQRNIRRPGRPNVSHGVLYVFFPTHSRRDPLSVDYERWPFDDHDYAIACTYCTAAAVVTVALPNTAFDGALHPLRMLVSLSTPNTERKILVGLYLKMKATHAPMASARFSPRPPR